MIVAPDLLIVGGLTVDRLADDSMVAGGSVLHAARAAVATGRSVATILAAGPEPEADAAVGELAGMGPSLVRRDRASIRYAIRESAGRRRLTLEASAAPLAVSRSELEALGAGAVLLAPVAGELTAEGVFASRSSPLVVGAIQGWLRSLEPGKVVRPLPLAALAPELSSVLGDLDAIVASDEDLAAVGGEPVSQLVALRDAFGPRPVLVVTVGAEGAWVDRSFGGRHHLPAPGRLQGIAAVGAGDVFAALLALELRGRQDPLAAATAAVTATTRLLAALTA